MSPAESPRGAEEPPTAVASSAFLCPTVELRVLVQNCMGAEVGRVGDGKSRGDARTPRCSFGRLRVRPNDSYVVLKSASSSSGKAPSSALSGHAHWNSSHSGCAGFEQEDSELGAPGSCGGNRGDGGGGGGTGVRGGHSKAQGSYSLRRLPVVSVQEAERCLKWQRFQQHTRQGSSPAAVPALPKPPRVLAVNALKRAPGKTNSGSGSGSSAGTREPGPQIGPQGLSSPSTSSCSSSPPPPASFELAPLDVGVFSVSVQLPPTAPAHAGGGDDREVGTPLVVGRRGDGEEVLFETHFLVRALALGLAVDLPLASGPTPSPAREPCPTTALEEREGLNMEPRGEVATSRHTGLPPPSHPLQSGEQGCGNGGREVAEGPATSSKAQSPPGPGPRWQDRPSRLELGRTNPAAPRHPLCPTTPTQHTCFASTVDGAASPPQDEGLDKKNHDVRRVSSPCSRGGSARTTTTEVVAPLGPPAFAATEVVAKFLDEASVWDHYDELPGGFLVVKEAGSTRNLAD